MPRNMSVTLTMQQVLDRLKDVTRRLGWEFLEEGDVINLVEKCMGLKKGEKLNRICQVRIKSVRRERLDRMITEPGYGKDECRREGFPDMNPQQFVDMFCRHMKCTPDTEVTRIEFEYID